MPRIAVVAALAPVTLWVMALALGVQSFRPAPLAVATLFELFVAIAIAVSLRRNRVAAPSSTGRYVIGLVVAALVIGTLTAAALAATNTAANSTLFDDGVHH